MKIYIILLIVLLTVSSANSQNTAFLNTDKLWAVLHEYSGVHIHPNDPYPFIKTTWYKIGGDTIINEKNYKHLLASNDSLKLHWTQNGAIREEEMKVYYFNNSNEILLYDFDININDTISLLRNGTNVNYVLDSIGFYTTEINELKAFYYSTFTNKNPEWKINEIWLEGIGSLNGLLNESCAFLTPCDDNYELLCYLKNGMKIYSAPGYNNCYLNSGIITKKVIEPNKKWMYAIGQEYPTPIINRYDCLTIGEDTVISNKEYYKLYNLYNCEYENSKLRGFIRETEDAKVYFQPVNEKQEWLLYDFGLNIGDSIYTDWNDSYLYMDSIVTDETNKKIYYVRFQNQSIQWIEEVGSNIGLLMERITGGLRIFTCCFRNEELIYRLPEYSSCDITLSNEVNKMPVPFNLYPNPASEKINIVINKSPTNTLTGKIIAIDGTIIKSFKIDNKPNYILDVHSLKPGLYFIQIRSGAETYTKKVIIK